MKNKNKRVVGIAVIALCLSMLAFGVYAAKNAKLTANGSVGFIAHDCMVDVLTQIKGDAVEDGVINQDGVPRKEFETFIDKVSLGTNADNINVVYSTDSENEDTRVPKIYFSDLTPYGVPETITIKFLVENKSDYPVMATLVNQRTTEQMAPITVTVNEASVRLEKFNDEVDDTDNGELSVSFNLEKTEDENGTLDYLDVEEIMYSLKVEFKKAGAGAETPEDPETPVDPELNPNGLTIAEQLLGVQSSDDLARIFTEEGYQYNVRDLSGDASGAIVQYQAGSSADKYAVVLFETEEQAQAYYDANLDNIAAMPTPENTCAVVGKTLYIRGIIDPIILQLMTANTAQDLERIFEGYEADIEEFDSLEPGMEVGTKVACQASKDGINYFVFLFDNAENSLAAYSSSYKMMFDQMFSAGVTGVANKTNYCKVGSVKLDAPTVINFDSTTKEFAISEIAEAARYRYVWIDAEGRERMVYEGNVTSGVFDIVPCEAGEYTIKVSAITNELNYTSSDYVSIGTITVADGEDDACPSNAPNGKYIKYDTNGVMVQNENVSLYGLYKKYQCHYEYVDGVEDLSKREEYIFNVDQNTGEITEYDKNFNYVESDFEPIHSNTNYYRLVAGNFVLTNESEYNSHKDIVSSNGYFYDENGNLTSRSEQTYAYTYNAENRMTEKTEIRRLGIGQEESTLKYVTTYTYNSEGQPLTQVETEYHLENEVYIEIKTSYTNYEYDSNVSNEYETNLTKSEVLEYDSNDLLIRKRIDLYSNGQPYYIEDYVEYRYDGEGNLLEYRKITESIDSDERTDAIYDAEGNVIRTN